MSYPSYQQSLPQSFRCYNHPAREGVGICVSCRSVVCVECSTKIDRMNYCIRCLQAAAPAQAAEQPNRVSEAVLGIPLLVAAFLAAVGIFVVFGYVLANLRHLVPSGVSAG